MLERLKELETSQNYAEMLNELRKHESITTQAYARISSFITNPTILGILKALEEMSVTATSLLRHCSDLMEDETVAAPLAAEADVSSTISVPAEAARDRDNMFGLDDLQTILSEISPKEISEEGAKISATFWYIKGGKNESIELNLSEREIFGKIILDILKQIEVGSDEKFSISPLGYEALLRHQLQNSFGQIVKTYGEEFTLIKLYT
ncbi:MAG: hypothetical protein JSW11_16030 [Candidatus Heimdallarchaeota archaeon]|nr:MAG: hypothetical protein JSW11_16030 [Candidatus Heimdallarchaeota archaeon]